MDLPNDETPLKRGVWPGLRSPRLGYSACPADPTLDDVAGQLTGQSSPTTIDVAREFLTRNPAQARAPAVAVKHGPFVAANTRAEVEAAAGKGAKVDTTFAAKAAIAGFFEQHVHPVLAALTMNTKVISLEDWDAIDGFSAAVRDENGYLELMTPPMATTAPGSWTRLYSTGPSSATAVPERTSPSMPPCRSEWKRRLARMRI